MSTFRAAATPALATLLVAVVLGGCGAPPPPKGPPPLKSAIDTPVARFFPAVDGTVHAYETKDLIAGTSGVLMLRTKVIADRTIELTSSKTQRLRYDDKGVLREPQGAYVLRTPLTVGESWPGGPNVSVSIVKIDQTVTVPAGTFKGCLETLDKRVGAVSGTVRSVYCPDVGLVLLESEGKGSQPGQEIHERVELKSFGKELDLSKAGAVPLATTRHRRQGIDDTASRTRRPDGHCTGWRRMTGFSIIVRSSSTSAERFMASSCVMRPRESSE
jgi:hypothetical protein